MSKSRKPRPYVQRGNVYLLKPTPPKIDAPTPEVRAQIDALEKNGVKTLRLDREGRVHEANVEPIDLYVAAEGARAASWLVFHHRHRFHRSGYVDFCIPVEKETPIWFRVAFEFIRRKSNSFYAHLGIAQGFRHYTVRWEKWNTLSPRARAASLLRPPANVTS